MLKVRVVVLLWLTVCLTSWTATNPMLEKDPGERAKAFKALTEFQATSDTWKWLLEGLADSTIEVKEAATSTLGQLLRRTTNLPEELSEKSDAIVAICKDDQVTIQSWAFEILAHYPAPDPKLVDTAKELVESTRSEKPLVWALDALGKFSKTDPRHIGTLAKFLKHPDTSVRKVAASNLASLGAAALPALDALMASYEKGTDRSERGFAAEALSKIGAPAAAAVPALLKGAREDMSLYVRFYSIVALRKIAPTDERVVEILKVVLKDEPSSFVRAAVDRDSPVQGRPDTQG